MSMDNLKKNVILTPNPYRDRNFQTVLSAERILRDAGMNVKICLPFEVDKSYELPKNIGLNLSFNNFITITGYDGLDPEVPGATYPTTRSVSAGLTLGF